MVVIDFVMELLDLVPAFDNETIIGEYELIIQHQWFHFHVRILKQSLVTLSSIHISLISQFQIGAIIRHVVKRHLSDRLLLFRHF